MIQIDFAVMQFIGDATIAISTLVFVIDSDDLCLGLGILILCALPLAVLVVCRPG